MPRRTPVSQDEQRLLHRLQDAVAEFASSMSTRKAAKRLNFQDHSALTAGRGKITTAPKLRELAACDVPEIAAMARELLLMRKLPVSQFDYQLIADRLEHETLPDANAFMFVAANPRALLTHTEKVDQAVITDILYVLAKIQFLEALTWAHQDNATCLPMINAGYAVDTGFRGSDYEKYDGFTDDVTLGYLHEGHLVYLHEPDHQKTIEARTAKVMRLLDREYSFIVEDTLELTQPGQTNGAAYDEDASILSMAQLISSLSMLSDVLHNIRHTVRAHPVLTPTPLARLATALYPHIENRLDHYIDLWNGSMPQLMHSNPASARHAVALVDSKLRILNGNYVDANKAIELMRKENLEYIKVGRDGKIVEKK